VRATDLAAWMFAFCASMPRIRLLVPASCYHERGRGVIDRQRLVQATIGDRSRKRLFLERKSFFIL
jgi:hypothetical protein